VATDLAATPEEIVVAASTKGPVTRYIVVESPRNKFFEIKGVECPLPSVKVDVKRMETWGTAKYGIEVSGLTPTSDLDSKALLVKTDMPSAPTLRIPLRISRPDTSPPANRARPDEETPRKSQDVEEGALRCEEKTADCGKVRIGQSAQHTFRLFNTSNEMQHIVKVTSACSCTKVIGFSKDIAPKSWGEVAVSLDTNGNPGQRWSPILIATDNPKQPELNLAVSCDVLPAIEIKPQALRFAPEKAAADFASQTIEVVGLYPDEKLSLGNIQTSAPMISVATETVEEHKRFRLIVSVSKDAPAGTILARLMIYVEGSAQKLVRLPVTIANEVRMKAEPSVLELPVGNDVLQNPEFVVKVLDGSPLEVKKVELANKELSVTSRRVASDAVAIRLQNIKMTCNMNLRHIVVSTNHGELWVPTIARSCPLKKDQTTINTSASLIPAM
jgi:hypothetical protein